MRHFKCCVIGVLLAITFIVPEASSSVPILGAYPNSAGSCGAAGGAFAPAPATQFFVRSGEDLFKVDLQDLSTEAAAVALGVGTVTVSMQRALVPDGRGSLILKNAAGGDDYVLLGTNRDLATADAMIAKEFGFNLFDILFEEVASMTVTGDSLGLTTEHRVGPDIVSATVPWPLLTKTACKEQEQPSPSPSIHVNINGWSTDVPRWLDLPKALEGASNTSRERSWSPTGKDAGELWTRPEFPDGLVHLTGVVAAVLQTESLGYSTSSEKASCFLSCAGCGLALIGYGVSIGGLIASCGATLGASCIWAVVGHEVAVGGLVVSCAGCVDCFSEPE